jgi:hypothetical protein
MDLYSFSLALGGAGLGVMALSGLGHALSHSGSHADGLRAGGQLNVHGHGHTHLHGVKGSHSHGQGTHARGGMRAGGVKGSISQRLWMLLSPRVLFSALVGFGATGLAARALSAGPRLAIAVLGAVLLERFVVSPLWNFYMRFGSEPAMSLEGCLGDEARAVTHFDERGQGVVAIELDGRVVQLLGTLRSEDRQAGMRVRAGDAVWIDDVDETRNRCTVRPFQA